MNTDEEYLDSRLFAGPRSSSADGGGHWWFGTSPERARQGSLKKTGRDGVERLTGGSDATPNKRKIATAGAQARKSGPFIH